MTTERDVCGWAAGLDGVMDRIAPRFGRAEPRRRAGAYLRGLLAPIERKNGWQLAEAAGDATPDGVQEFLSRACWDADAVRDDLQAYAVEHLGDPGAVLVLDETGFLKKGLKSAGVQRQYTGTAGRIENAQVGVFLGYAGQHGRALIDRALYVPDTWAGDDARRREARIPADVTLVTKPKQGLAMSGEPLGSTLERARAAGVLFSWVAGDSVYGADSAIRRWAERHRRGYVMAVTSGQRLGQRPVTTWAEDLPDAAWRRLSAGDGAKGPRLYDWAHLPFNGGAEGFACAFLVRRSIAKPEEVAFHLTHAPNGTTLAELVRIAGTRWSIDQRLQQRMGARQVSLSHPSRHLDQPGRLTPGAPVPPLPCANARRPVLLVLLGLVHAVFRLLLPGRQEQAPVMFAVDEATAFAIRQARQDGGELSGMVELRRHFPLITDNARARLCLEVIMSWGPPTPSLEQGPASGKARPRPRRKQAT